MSSKYETTFPIVPWPKNFIGVLVLLNFDLICVLLIELRFTRFYATISTDITIKTCMYVRLKVAAEIDSGAYSVATLVNVQSLCRLCNVYSTCCRATICIFLYSMKMSVGSGKLSVLAQGHGTETDTH